MKLGDDEAVLWGTMMYLAGLNAAGGGGRIAALQVTAEDARKAKAAVAAEFETFKKKAKALRRKVN